MNYIIEHNGTAQSNFLAKELKEYIEEEFGYDTDFTISDSPNIIIYGPAENVLVNSSNVDLSYLITALSIFGRPIE